MTRLRFRSDSSFAADDAARLERGHRLLWHNPEEVAGVDPARPGDCWRIRWHASEGQGPIAGYAICCPKCLQVHSWTTARNCGQRVTRNGVEVCIHSGVSSCWEWTGSAEEGTLTARPSLHAIDDGKAGTGVDAHGCGWHGWLTNGVLSPC